MAEGPPSAGVAHINAHGQKHFNGVLRCRWTEGKGRVVHATRSYEEGEVILVESPLHIVQEDPKSAAFRKLKQLCKKRGDDFDYEPLWYWCALKSLTAQELEGAHAGGWPAALPETQHNLLLLHHEEVEKPSTASEALVKELAPSADPTTIERLTQIWVLNCFEYSDTPQGYSTYFFSSFMSHSCFPNAVWHYSGADHVLRARRNIGVGDEVCISYLPEHGLLQAAPVRRWDLFETKRFWCTCERCRSGQEDLSRGFLCPKCQEGIVFASTPIDGPAQDMNLLQSELCGATCTACCHALSSTEAAKLSTLEQRLKDMVEESEEQTEGAKQRKPATAASLVAKEKFVDAHFRQHVLADLMWKHLAEAPAARNGAISPVRLLERRCDFHVNAYPGLNGATAWTQEALADEVRRGCWTGGGQGKRRRVPGDATAAAEHYQGALKILSLMFGEDHEYTEQVRSKLQALGGAPGAPPPEGS